MVPTLYHRLILPADANHKNTLYAGSMLRLALEAGYATAWKHVGPQANLVLRRLLNLECLRPVPVGTVIEIEGAVLHRTQVYLVTGLIGTPLEAGQGPWLEALLGFAQVDDTGDRMCCPKEPELGKCQTRIVGVGSMNGSINCCTYAEILCLRRVALSRLVQNTP